MKKFIALTAAAIASLMLLAGCGTYSKPPASTGDGTGSDDEKNPPKLECKFKVTLVYDGKQYIPENEVSAQWYDGTGKTVAKFNENGVAEAAELNGDYRVTLLGLDTAYTYNPNIYYATNDNPEVEIEVHRLSSVTGKGIAYKEYELKTTGYYRATFTNAEQAKNGLLFLYAPVREGKYSIESIVDITANEINPIANVYFGSRQFFKEDSFTVLDTGGVSASYTKNFKYDVQLRKDEIGQGIGQGNVFRYLIRFNSRISNVSYPFNIDFYVSYQGKADENKDDSVTVSVKEDFDARKEQIPDWNQTGKKWRYADTNKYLLGSAYKFNEEDGLWHVWDGENFGEVLWAKINKDSILIQTDSGSGFMDGLVSTKYLNGYNYDLFVAAYADNTNKDGCYPVTEEIRLFLQNYAVAQRYFMDGRGWAEAHGYKSSEEDQWLFNCGYYRA